MRRIAAIVLALLLVLLFAWLGLRRYEQHWLEQPIAALAAPRVYTIAPGASATAVARELQSAGLLEHPWLWLRQVRRQGAATRLRSGEYQLSPGASPAALLRQFVAGEVLLHAVTIPEGWTFGQALALIQSQPAITVAGRGLPAAELAAQLGFGHDHPEGLIFPDTYRFPRGTSDLELLRLAHRRLRQELDQAWSRRDTGLPLATPYAALILASLIEKETGAPGERAVIAGVFINRLRRGMRLQSDPTVIYGLGESFDGNLRHGDLRADTPYNSYTRAGLPPTPIALAGRAALDAAVRPAATEALYFVATGRGDGRHLFAATLAEHNANVARHLANLRAGRGDQLR